MDRSDFKSKVLPCYRRMYAAAMAVLRDSDDASDAVQDAFTRLWERRDELDTVISLDAYAMTVVRRICIDRIRSSRQLDRLDDVNLTSEAARPDDFDGREAVGVLKRLMGSLPGNQRRVLTLSSFGGCTNEEIARLTGESDSNVRQLLSRARKKLKELYQKYES